MNFFVISLSTYFNICSRLSGNRIRVEMSSGRSRSSRGGRGGGRDYGRRYGDKDGYRGGRGNYRFVKTLIPFLKIVGCRYLLVCGPLY